MLSIGSYHLTGQALLAPMAGVTDLPFRRVCLQHGAALAVSEMLTSDTALWHSNKSRTRLQLDDNKRRTSTPLSVQIAGADPVQMANAAAAAVALGADIIDINMGCPAKKVCNRAAGSALLRDEPLVAEILTSVMTAVDVPVTLKIRTGWCPATRNAVRIAKLAQDLGIQALTVHGRTRACRFNGSAEYQTIAEVVAGVSIPVIANGDITSAEQARRVLTETGAAAVMIGRAAQGNPWIFAAINQYLTSSHEFTPPSLTAVGAVLHEHLCGIYRLYGETAGARIARKHFAWYCTAHLSELLAQSERQQFNQLTTPLEQLKKAQAIFGHTEPLEDQAA